MTILHIDTSISGESRVSRTISKSVVDQFKAVMPGARLIRRDTEPSAVFRSDTGGGSWVDLAGLRALPSTDT
jgi:FMN-dependent NADH-azoreductase